MKVGRFLPSRTGTLVKRPRIRGKPACQPVQAPKHCLCHLCGKEIHTSI
jgi:hypothetical protein